MTKFLAICLVLVSIIHRITAQSPTAGPTAAPVANPTENPTRMPSVHPTVRPTSRPTEPTPIPSRAPSVTPTAYPSHYPSAYPTSVPTPFSPPVIMYFTIGIAVLNCSTDCMLNPQVQVALTNSTALVQSLPFKPAYGIPFRAVHFEGEFRRLEEIGSETDSAMGPSFHEFRRKLQLIHSNGTTPITYAVIGTTIDSSDIGCTDHTSVACYNNITAAVYSAITSGLYTSYLRSTSIAAGVVPTSYASVIAADLGGLQKFPMTSTPTMSPTSFGLTYLKAQKAVLIPIAVIIAILLFSSFWFWNDKSIIHMIFDIVLRLSDLLEDLLCLLFSQSYYNEGSGAQFIFSLFLGFALGKTVLEYSLSVIKYEALSAFVVGGMAEFVQAILYSTTCGNTPTSIALFGGIAILQSVGSLMQIDNKSIMLDDSLKLKRIDPISGDIMLNVIIFKVFAGLSGLFFALCYDNSFQTNFFQITLTIYLWSSDLANSLGIETQEFLIMVGNKVREVTTSNPTDSSGIALTPITPSADVEGGGGISSKNSAPSDNPLRTVSGVSTTSQPDWAAENAPPTDSNGFPTKVVWNSIYAQQLIGEVAHQFSQPSMEEGLRKSYGIYAKYLWLSNTMTGLLTLVTFLIIYSTAVPIQKHTQHHTFQYGFLTYIVVVGSILVIGLGCGACGACLMSCTSKKVDE